MLIGVVNQQRSFINDYLTTKKAFISKKTDHCENSTIVSRLDYSAYNNAQFNNTC